MIKTSFIVKQCKKQFQIGVDNAFLNEALFEEVYMDRSQRL